MNSRVILKVTYFVAASLDGYIAKTNGDVSWLDDFNIPPHESGYEDFFESIDGIVMGRKTYNFIEDYGTWPNGDKPTWVCTNSKINIMKGANIQSGTNPEQVYVEAQEMGINHLWLVGGGELAAHFLDKKFITDIYLTQIPIMLGEGIPIFGNINREYVLKLEHFRSSKYGFVQTEYKIIY